MDEKGPFIPKIMSMLTSRCDIPPPGATSFPPPKGLGYGHKEVHRQNAQGQLWRPEDEGYGTSDQRSKPATPGSASAGCSNRRGCGPDPRWYKMREPLVYGRQEQSRIKHQRGSIMQAGDR
jgi:hypothetical protein